MPSNCCIEPETSDGSETGRSCWSCAEELSTRFREKPTNAPLKPLDGKQRSDGAGKPGDGEKSNGGAKSWPHRRPEPPLPPFPPRTLGVASLCDLNGVLRAAASSRIDTIVLTSDLVAQSDPACTFYMPIAWPIRIVGACGSFSREAFHAKMGVPSTSLQAPLAPNTCVLDAQSRSRHFRVTRGASNVTFENLAFVNGFNHSSTRIGGGAVLSEASVNFKNVVFWNNSAGGGTDAGAVRISNGYGASGVSAVFESCLFANNTAPDDETGRLPEGSGGPAVLNGRGGAIAMKGVQVSEFKACTFIGNKASIGGAVHAEVGQGMQGAGDVVFNDCSFDDNSAGEGRVGAIASLLGKEWESGESTRLVASFCGCTSNRNPLLHPIAMKEVILLNNLTTAYVDTSPIGVEKFVELADLLHNRERGCPTILISNDISWPGQIHEDLIAGIRITREVRVKGGCVSRGACLIDAKDIARHFRIRTDRSETVTFEMLELRKGLHKNDEEEQGGGSIFVESGSGMVNFESLHFVENRGIQSGGAVYVREGAAPATFSNCTFRWNSLTKDGLLPGKKSYGGAVSLYEAAATFISCTFENNVADEGAAVNAYDASTTFATCAFINNTDESRQPKTFHTFQTKFAKHQKKNNFCACDFDGNQGIADQEHITIDPKEEGEALYPLNVQTYDTYHTMVASTFAELADGIKMWESMSTTAQRMYVCVIRDIAWPTVDPTGISIQADPLSINAKLEVVGACASNTPPLSGAVPGACILDGQDQTNLFNITSPTDFVDLALVNGNHRTGGAITVEGHDSSHFIDVLFANNSATNGGAVSALRSDRLMFERCRFTNCSAAWKGGAVFMQQSRDAYFSRCVFEGNEVQRDSHRDSFNLYAQYGTTATLERTTFASCQEASCGLERADNASSIQIESTVQSQGRRRHALHRRRMLLNECAACSCNRDDPPAPSAHSPNGPVAFLSSVLGILVVCGALVLTCVSCAYLISRARLRERKRQHLETNEGLEDGALAGTELASLMYRTGAVGTRALSDASTHARVSNRDASADSVWAYDDLFADNRGSIFEEDHAQALTPLGDVFHGDSARRFSVLNPLASPMCSDGNGEDNSLYLWNAPGTGGVVTTDVEAAVSMELESLATIESAVVAASSSGDANLEYVLAEITEVRAAYISIGQLLEDQEGQGTVDGGRHQDAASFERRLASAREGLRGIERSVTVASGMLGGSARTNLIDQILRVRSKLRRVSGGAQL